MHTLNDQVFRGFFTVRYLFDSVEGFLRYSSSAASGGFGPFTAGCSNGTSSRCLHHAGRNDVHGWSPAVLSAGAGRTGLATDATGASKITNEELSLFIQ
jgi:hypothetical protein